MPQGSNRYVKYRFTVTDFAAAFGMTEAAVRKAIQRHSFDPRSLVSIFHFWVQHRRKDDHVPLPSILASHPSVEKPNLTIKKAHDTVGAATDAAAVPLGGEHEP